MMASETRSFTSDETRKRLSSEVCKVDHHSKKVGQKNGRRHTQPEDSSRPSSSKGSRRSSDRSNDQPSSSTGGAVYKHGKRISDERSSGSGRRKSPVFEDKLPAAYRLSASHPKSHFNGRHNGSAPLFDSFPPPRRFPSDSTFHRGSSRGLIRGSRGLRRGGSSRGGPRRGHFPPPPSSRRIPQHSRRDFPVPHRGMPRGGHFGKPAVYRPPYEVSPDRNQRADSAPIVLDHKELMAKMREAKDADNLDEYHRYRDMLNELERSGRKYQSKPNHNKSSDFPPNIDELDLEEVDCIDTSEDREEHLNPHAHPAACRSDQHSKRSQKVSSQSKA